MEINWEAVGIVFFLILILGMGWLANDLYRGYSNHRDLDGLYLKNYNQTRVNEVTKEYDKYGDWVAVNVRGMTFKEAFETCSHEVGHEIFAEICEDNITKCLEIEE